MGKRVLTHYRFGKAFAWLNRNLRSRRKSIKNIRQLCKDYGLIADGCSLCKSQDFTLVAEGDRYGFDLKKQLCNQCGLLQTYPAPHPEFHKQFYSHHYRSLYLKQQQVDYRSVIQEQKTKGDKYLSYFRNHGLADDLAQLEVIEIGCSSGGTLNALKPFVKQVSGCDLDIQAIKFAQSNFGIDVQVGMYPMVKSNLRKLFILSHVLEHVFNPLDTLREIRQIMQLGDFLFIAVPGLNAVAEGSYKNDLRRYFHIAHVTDFTGGTLCNVARQAGFKVLNYDEEINGLFTADKVVDWTRNPADTPENLVRIESTYAGLPPHL